jgi:gas vesicle protein
MARDDNAISAGWFLVGAAIGAAIALLYAPQSGKDTRRLIAKKSEQSREVLLDSSKEVLDRGKELFDRGRELADEAADIFERGRKLVRG